MPLNLTLRLPSPPSVIPLLSNKEYVNTPLLESYDNPPLAFTFVSEIAFLISALLVIVALPTTTLVVVAETLTFTLSELTVTLGSVTVTVTFAKAI